MASAATLQKTSIIHQQDFPANAIEFYYMSAPPPFASCENFCQFWSGFSFLGRKTLEAYDVPAVHDLFKQKLQPKHNAQTKFCSVTGSLSRIHKFHKILFYQMPNRLEMKWSIWDAFENLLPSCWCGNKLSTAINKMNVSCLICGSLQANKIFREWTWRKAGRIQASPWSNSTYRIAYK